MLLAGRTREQRERPSAAAPSTTKPDQTSAKEVAGEMLLRDRGVTGRPALPELTDGWNQNLRDHGV